MKIKFEDLHDYAPSSGYTATNENIKKLHEFVFRRRPKRTAGICGGGDVGLFVLLPITQDELVLIDHSYASLTAAMLKFLMLSKLGIEDTIKYLTTNDQKVLQQGYKKIEKLSKELPDKCKEEMIKATGYWHSSMRLIYKCDYGYTSKYELCPAVKKQFKDFILETWIKAAVPKLDKVRFVHGDLTDLVKYGPFDLLYLSNALDHTSRSNSSPIVETINQIVKSNGLIIDACQPDSLGSNREIKRKNWTCLKQWRGEASHYLWYHSLFELPKIPSSQKEIVVT